MMRGRWLLMPGLVGSGHVDVPIRVRRSWTTLQGWTVVWVVSVMVDGDQ